MCSYAVVVRIVQQPGFLLNIVIPRYPWGFASLTPCMSKTVNSQVPCVKWHSVCTEPIQPFPSPGDRPSPGIKPRPPALQADSLPPELPGIPAYTHLLAILRIVMCMYSSWPQVATLSPSSPRFLSQSYFSQGVIHCSILLISSSNPMEVILLLGVQFFLWLLIIPNPM